MLLTSQANLNVTFEGDSTNCGVDTHVVGTAHSRPADDNWPEVGSAIEYTVRERLWERAERLGNQAIETLRGLGTPSVREVRGLGLMIGIELRGKAGPVLQALQDEGILAVGGGSSVIRLLPPLVIPEEQWFRAIDAIGRALQHG